MIPTRTRLNSWNLGTLLDNKKTLWQAGQDIEMAVHSLRSDCDSLPELRAWSGESHDAAVSMLARTARHAAFFGDIADDATGILDSYYHWLVSVRDRINTLAASIEGGPLYVSDQWIVLLDPEPMDAQRTEVLRKAQNGFQQQINPLITELGQVEDQTVDKLRNLNYRYSDVRLDPGDPTVHPRPDDGVPDPQYEGGRKMQEDLQAQDAAVTVAGITEEDNDGSHVKTIMMQDGSKQVATTTATYQAPPGTLYPVTPGFGPPAGYPGDPMQRVEKFDSSGNLMSSVQTVRSNYFKGATWTNVNIPGQGGLSTKKDSDGDVTANMWGPDGKISTIPEDSSFFTHPSVTTIGGAVTGLETAANKGALDMALDADTVNKVRVGSKFAGPGIGVATTVWDMAAAETPREQCVAGVAGTVSTVGSTALGAAAGIPGSTVSGPIAGFVGAAAGTWVFGALGARLGEAVC